MTLEERIEAAARAHSPWDYRERKRGDVLTEADMAYNRASNLRHMERALRAAFPELFTDPPTAWIAPIEPTASMSKSVTRVLSHFDGEFGEYNVYFEPDQADKIYAAMRDSHLSTLKGEKPNG